MLNENNMKREKTELEEKIYSDVQLEIQKYYDNEGIEYKKKEEPEDTILDFFSYLLRLIPPIQREVHYSKELLRKIELNEISKEHTEILKEYADAFFKGKDMNIFLSNNIKKAREADFLLYTWHLFHLHLSGKFIEDKNQMKNNRSNTQLLCIINQNDVYFIDVIQHPVKAEEYFDIKNLETIINNGWIEKIGFSEMKDMIPGSLQPKITEAKDIFKIYSCGINMAFEFKGKGYCPLEHMSSVRRPYAATNEMFKINRAIFKLNGMNGTYKGFKMGCDDKGNLVGIVQFEMPTGEIKDFNIF